MRSRKSVSRCPTVMTPSIEKRGEKGTVVLTSRPSMSGPPLKKSSYSFTIRRVNPAPASTGGRCAAAAGAFSARTSRNTKARHNLERIDASCRDMRKALGNQLTHGKIARKARVAAAGSGVACRSDAELAPDRLNDGRGRLRRIDGERVLGLFKGRQLAWQELRTGKMVRARGQPFTEDRGL